MLYLPDQRSVTDQRTNERVVARFVELTGKLAREGIADRWWSHPDLDREAARREPDFSWDWPRCVKTSKEHVFHQRVAVLAADDPDVQGAMVYRANAASQLSEDRVAVEVVWLATAPWNRPWLTGSPRFRGVGSALLLRAGLHSQQAGLDGIVLDAARSPRTLAYYETRGFSTILDTGFGTIKMQMSAETLERWLREEGLLE